MRYNPTKRFLEKSQKMEENLRKPEHATKKRTWSSQRGNESGNGSLFATGRKMLTGEGGGGEASFPSQVKDSSNQVHYDRSCAGIDSSQPASQNKKGAAAERKEDGLLPHVSLVFPVRELLNVREAAHANPE